MFLPLSPDLHDMEPKSKTPIANMTLIGVNVLISALLLGSAGLGTADGLHWAVLQRGAASSPIQLVTHAFLHVGVWHLLGNMICLFAFGNALNKRLGHLCYLGLYLGLCLAGGLAWLFFGNGQAAVGASGAAMGLCGLFFFVFPRLPMNVFIHAQSWFVLAVFVSLSLTAAIVMDSPLSGSARWVVVWSALAVYMAWTLASIASDRPPEGVLLRLLGFRVVKLGGWLVMPLLVAQDVVALFLGAKTGIAHSAHVGGAVTGVVLGVALTGYGLVRGSRGQPTLLEWLGLRDTPSPVRPSYVSPATPRRRTESARFRRATTRRQLSFSDWQRQRSQEVTS